MIIDVRRAELKEVEALRALCRQEADCQIVHDSFLARGLADPYIIVLNGRLGGYGVVGNTYPPNRVTEFYTFPAMRPFVLPMFREVLAASGATQIEAQTNMALMLLMLYDCATNITVEAILFEDAFTSNLACPACVFRRGLPEDAAAVFPHTHEPVGEWLLESDDRLVATGGFLTHYNPPYADIFMEVAEAERRKGFGSFLVQELKRVCYEAGKKPTARCTADNTASRRTLQKTGFLPCGHLLAGDVVPSG